MFINWNAKLTAKDYEKILLDNNKEIGFATKLLIVDDMRYFDKYKELTEEEKDKMIDYVYSYYVESDNSDMATYKIISYTFNNLMDNFGELTYSDFETEINDNVF